MTVVVRNAWHHIDVGTLPLAELPNSGRWIMIEEFSRPPTKQQWELLRKRAEECNIAWRRGYYAPTKEKECMFKED